MASKNITRNATLTNNCSYPVTVSAVEVTGTGFSLASAFTSTEIAANGSINVDVKLTYDDTVVANYTGNLTATVTGGDPINCDLAASVIACGTTGGTTVGTTFGTTTGTTVGTTAGTTAGTTVGTTTGTTTGTTQPAGGQCTPTVSTPSITVIGIGTLTNSGEYGGAISFYDGMNLISYVYDYVQFNSWTYAGLTSNGWINGNTNEPITADISCAEPPACSPDGNGTPASVCYNELTYTWMYGNLYHLPDDSHRIMFDGGSWKDYGSYMPLPTEVICGDCTGGTTIGTSQGTTFGTTTGGGGSCVPDGYGNPASVYAPDLDQWYDWSNDYFYSRRSGGQPPMALQYYPETADWHMGDGNPYTGSVQCC